MCFFWRSRFFVLAAFLGLTILLLCNPAAAASGFAQGVSLCLHTLLPALFPFFVTCSMVASASRQKGSFWTALFLSGLGGYAVCASLVRDLLTQGKLSKRDAQLLFMLGCCSGPGFVIGCIGGQMLGSVRTGILPVSYTHLDVYKRQPLWLLRSQQISTEISMSSLSGRSLKLSTVTATPWGTCLLYTSRCV